MRKRWRFSERQERGSRSAQFDTRFNFMLIDKAIINVIEYPSRRARGYSITINRPIDLL